MEYHNEERVKMWENPKKQYKANKISYFLHKHYNSIYCLKLVCFTINRRKTLAQSYNTVYAFLARCRLPLSIRKQELGLQVESKGRYQTKLTLLPCTLYMILIYFTMTQILLTQLQNTPSLSSDGQRRLFPRR